MTEPVLGEAARRRLEERRAALPRYEAERSPVLVDFLAGLEMDDPLQVRHDAGAFIGPVDAWLRYLTFEESDAPWLCARLGYLIGEVFVQRYGGRWLVEARPESRWFARFVVGDFAARPDARMDPNEAAMALLREATGRSLAAMVERIDAALAPE